MTTDTWGNLAPESRKREKKHTNRVTRHTRGQAVRELYASSSIDLDDIEIIEDESTTLPVFVILFDFRYSEYF